MADCSKAEEFLAEVYRMGMSCEGNDDGGCEHCLISPICNITKFSNKEWREKVISCVQKWSNKHPLPKQKTYADDFFEKYPNAKRHENGRPLVYRCDVYGCECNYKKAPEVIYWRGKQGIDDCLMCWNEPYKAREEANGA